MGGGYLFNSVIIPAVSDAGMPKNEAPGITAITAGVLFGILILRFIYLELKEKLLSEKSLCSSGCCEGKQEIKTIMVSGITCEGCAAKLKTALLAVSGVASVSVDVSSGKVEISGASFNSDAISDAVTRFQKH